MRIVPGGLFAEFAQGREFGVDLLKPRARRSEQPLARFRRATLRVVRVKSRTQAALRGRDGVAQRRLRNAELRRGPGEALLSRDREKRDDIIEVFPAIHESCS